jgi:translation initiation factor IF-3
LLVLMKFWMEDKSTGFEKTDIFIEKAVKATFDLIENTPVQSLIDLGKFLYKEMKN